MNDNKGKITRGTDMFNCIKFARKYPELSNGVELLSWLQVTMYPCRQP